MRLTKSRKLVYDLFKKNTNLICAEDISELLKAEKIDLSTIYRTLEYFLSENLIEKSTINNRAYYYLKDGEHHHYMICTSCLKRIPIDCEFDKMFKKTIKDRKFRVTGHDITVYGYCEKCQDGHHEGHHHH